jgi:DNA-binding NtrC family response regulator
MSTRILVVDDDQDTGHLIKTLLLEKNYDVNVVIDRDAALLSVKRYCPEVILLDLRTEGLPIQELISATTTISPKTRIILMSGIPDLRTISLVLGLTYYLEKPFSVEKLVSLIEDIKKSGEHAAV